ncbi:hypothetical protein FRC01_009765 [Tulasnella sp. 417]|nr:hypothetical protein FRC01_009765 [Tulasnella sp. 417]
MNQPTPTNDERRKVLYPMEIFDDQPSDSDSDSDARSWHSAKSTIDHEDEDLLMLPSLSVVEEADRFVEATLGAALPQLSMNDSIKLPPPDHRDSGDSDDAMSISDIDTSEANSSWTVADTIATAMDDADDPECEEPFPHPSSPGIFPHIAPSPEGKNAASSSRRVRPSQRALADFSIIAHSKRHTEWFDKYGVPWSVQWQVAVMVSSGMKEWDRITEKDIQALSGKNSVVGPKVLGVLFPDERQRTPANLAQNRLGNLYLELEKEEESLNRGSLETLGLSPQPDNATELRMGTWWGGRIEQRAVIVQTETRQSPKSICNGAPAPKISWKIQLRHQAMRGKSCRFTRKFGSRRFIQLGIPDLKKLTPRERNSLKKVLLKPHLLLGRIFCAFSAHDGTVRLVETDEDYERSARREAGDLRRLSFRKFLDWFNPLERNAAQASYLNNGRLTVC